MKRKLLFFLLLICSLTISAQSSICGVPFGQSYDFAKTLLQNKFGKAEIEENNELWYFERSYAEFSFGFIVFKFQSDITGNTYFNECFMGRKFKDVSLAKTFRNKIIAKLMKKYDDVEVYTDKNKFLGAHGGTSPVDEDKYGFDVFVVNDKETKEYIVYLSYGPYNYANEEF